MGIEEAAVADVPAAVAQERRAFSRAYRSYVLAVLVGVYALNVLDRTILITLQEVVKRDLSLSDTQLALLNGIGFFGLYAVASLAFARWADTGRRPSVLAWAIFVWSTATAACGLVGNFIQLLFARSAVGAGEAGSAPTSHSMISDMYPAEDRGLAIGILSSGVFLGHLLGMSIGGWLGSLYGWRHTLVIVGVVGIAFVILVRLTVAEPARRKSASEGTVSFLALARILFRSRSAPHLVMGSLLCCTSSSIMSFMPSVVLRSHALNLQQMGLWLGLAGGIGGVLGVLITGRVTDRLSQGGLWKLPWVPAVAMLSTAPILMLALATMNVPAILAAFFVINMTVSAPMSPGVVILHSLAPDQARARASAVFILAQNFLGVSTASLLIGLISDHLSGRFGASALRYAMMIVFAGAAGWMIFHMQRASHHLRKADEAMRSATLGR